MSLNKDNLGLSFNKSILKELRNVDGNTPQTDVGGEEVSFRLLRDTLQAQIAHGNYAVVLVNYRNFNKLLSDQAALRLYDSSFKLTDSLVPDLLVQNCTVPYHVVFSNKVADQEAVILGYDLVSFQDYNNPDKVIRLVNIKTA
jgi:hypothetical protein